MRIRIQQVDFGYPVFLREKVETAPEQGRPAGPNFRGPCRTGGGATAAVPHHPNMVLSTIKIAKVPKRAL